MLAKKLVGQALNPVGEAITLTAQERDNFVFAAQLLLFSGHLHHEAREVETFERGAALDSMDLFL